MSGVIFSTDLSARSLPNIDILKSKMSAPIYKEHFCHFVFKMVLNPFYIYEQIHLHVI